MTAKQIEKELRRQVADFERAIENGYKIRVKETEYETVGVDTPDQIYLAEEFLESNLL